MSQISETMKRHTLKYMDEMSDAHCHLDMFEDPGATIKDAKESGVIVLITAGGSAKSNINGSDIAKMYDVFSVIGIDPTFAKSDFDFIDEIESHVHTNKNIIGIGEIGLDYKLNGIADHDTQKGAFIKQIKIAKKLNFPIVVHARNAIDDVIKIIEDNEVERVMFHYFEGTPEQAKKLAKMGHLISIPPIESGMRKKVIKEVDISSIAVETDSPAVAKSPKDVSKAIDFVARTKGIEFGEAALRTTENVKRFFYI